MSKQDYLRREVRLAKALEDDLYYKDMANYIGITEYSFYNFLKGYYDLSRKKERMLHEILIDLIDM